MVIQPVRRPVKGSDLACREHYNCFFGNQGSPSVKGGGEEKRTLLGLAHASITFCFPRNMLLCHDKTVENPMQRAPSRAQMHISISAITEEITDPSGAPNPLEISCVSKGIGFLISPPHTSIFASWEEEFRAALARHEKDVAIGGLCRSLSKQPRSRRSLSLPHIRPHRCGSDS